MQDFDALRDRVETMTRKLKSAHAERQDRTESLVAILRQLEEKHAAQAQQLAYYRTRIEPLEVANQQLTGLMENLLDLIDSGFGEESLAPLQKASSMASAMLESDLFIPGHDAPSQPLDLDVTDAADANTDIGEPEGVAELEETAPAADNDDPVGDDDVMADPDDGLVAMADDLADMDADMDEVGYGAGDEAADDETEDAAVADLEMEEDALISLDELLDLASDETPEETIAFEEAETVSVEDRPVEIDDDAIDEDLLQSEPADAVAENTADADVAGDAIIDDGGFDSDFFAEDTGAPEAVFEDVTDAALELESEEDAAMGVDDLPDVVRNAMAAFDSGEVDPVPEIPRTADEAAADAEAVDDDLETIAALAQAIEEETASADASPPAQSDIRALLLRVEKLAKKAESMRLAHGDATKPEDAPKADTPAEKSRKQGAAA